MGVFAALRRSTVTLVANPGLVVVASPLAFLLPLYVVWPMAVLRSDPRLAIPIIVLMLLATAFVTLVRPLVLPGISRTIRSEATVGIGFRTGFSVLAENAGDAYEPMALALGFRLYRFFRIAAPVAFVGGLAVSSLPHLLHAVQETAFGPVVLALAALTVMVLVARLYLTGFADLYALAGGEPNTAWRRSRGASLRRPVALAGYALVKTAVLTTPFVVTWMLTWGPPTEVNLGFVPVLAGLYVVAIPGMALLEVFRVEFFDAVLQSG